MNKQYTKGVTLIEVLFVLGITAILIGMIMILYSQSSNREKSNNMAIEVVDIFNAVNSFRENESPINMTTINEKILARSGLISAKYINKDHTTLIDPFGASIQVFVDESSMAINFNDVSPQACLALMTYDYGDSAKQFQIGDSGILLAPLEMSNITKWCKYGNTFMEIVMNI